MLLGCYVADFFLMPTQASGWPAPESEKQTPSDPVSESQSCLWQLSSASAASTWLRTFSPCSAASSPDCKRRFTAKPVPMPLPRPVIHLFVPSTTRPLGPVSGPRKDLPYRLGSGMVTTRTPDAPDFAGALAVDAMELPGLGVLKRNTQPAVASSRHLCPCSWPVARWRPCVFVTFQFFHYVFTMFLAFRPLRIPSSFRKLRVFAFLLLGRVFRVLLILRAFARGCELLLFCFWGGCDY